MKHTKGLFGVMITVFCFLFCSTTYGQTTENSVLVYTNNFNGVVGTEWSNPRTSTTPGGDRRFLGEFGSATSLTLSNLPPHSHLVVSFDLFIIKSWDGDGVDDGPDIFAIEARAKTVFRASFSSHEIAGHVRTQSYPAQSGAQHFGFGTGAVELNTLHYTWDPRWVVTAYNADSVYHLTKVIQDSSPDIVITLRQTNGSDSVIVDESWGIDNFSVNAINLPEQSSPVIVSEPNDQIVGLNKRAVLTVTAASTLPLSYQWLFNGSVIQGQTNDFYVIDNVNINNDGEYKVEVRNSEGTATSRAIKLAAGSPRRAKAIPQIVNGFIVGINITDGGWGYTNAPKVQILGLGAGATAKATVVNGQVTQITVVSAGSGFGVTSTQILIEPPPKVPTLTIAVQSVNITFSVWQGKHYAIESSTDLKAWTLQLDLIAEADVFVREFEATATGQYFRIRELP